MSSEIKDTHVDTFVITEGEVGNVDYGEIVQEVIKAFPDVEHINLKIIQKEVIQG